MYTPEFSKPRVLSVSQLNFYIKSIIENDARLNFVFVTGEISNLTDHYRSGHIYLSIKDEKSVIRAVMFAGNARNLKFRPTDGMKVICRGRVAVYEPTGQYQLYIEDMQPDGIGALSLAYEQLKKSLAEKGLFAPEHKKKIPPFPNSIGVITSPTGAAVQDIRNILSRRFPSADIIMCPVLVQGDNAPAQLIDAVQKLDKYNACDVIIIGRGGGSIEDLWAFNDENLAYAIYNCKIPVISAVGHETDFTICDFVSDLRAPTPSAAAELCVPERARLEGDVRMALERLRSAATGYVGRIKAELSDMGKSAAFQSAHHRIVLLRSEVAAEQSAMANYMRAETANAAHSIESLTARLEALSPGKVLERGYGMVQAEGRYVGSAAELKEGLAARLIMRDGTANITVDSINILQAEETPWQRRK